MAGNTFSLTPIDVEHIETNFRKIKTQLPVPQSVELLKKIENLETRAMHGQLPLIWDRAEGFQVYDKWGNIWLDFTSTIFVANSGHANKRIISGLKEIT